MKNRNGRLMSVADFQAELAKAPEKLFAVAGDERLLARLPRGNWLGGTIPYLMSDEDGGLTTRDSLMVQELLVDERAAPKIKFYDKNTIARVTEDAPANGYTFVMMPAFSEVHLAYGKDAPHFKDLFAHPIVGWVTGIHLNDLGKETPKVFNGKTGEVFADQAIACHVSLPAGKTADVEIVNIFERSEGPDIRFETDGFGPVTGCSINGKKTNFARWLTDNAVDTKLPLMADYNGALINVSIQGVDPKAGRSPSTRRCSRTGRTAWPSRCRTTSRASGRSPRAPPMTSLSPATVRSTMCTASSTERGWGCRGLSPSARLHTSCSTRRWSTATLSTQRCRTREGGTSPSRWPRRVEPRRSAVLTTEGGAAASPLASRPRPSSP